MCPPGSLLREWPVGMLFPAVLCISHLDDMLLWTTRVTADVSLRKARPSLTSPSCVVSVALALAVSLVPTEAPWVKRKPVSAMTVCPSPELSLEWFRSGHACMGPEVLGEVSWGRRPGSG